MHRNTILLVLRLYMFRAAFLPSSGVLSRTSALVHFMKFWWPYATRSRMALPCRLRTPDDGRKAARNM